MIWTMLIYSTKRQLFTSGSFVVCVWRRRSSDQEKKGRGPTVRHVFQNPELLLIGYSIESIWTPESKSNTLTPKTNSQTYWPREISHLMSGIIWWACSILIISVPQFAPIQWRNDLNKIQEKNESQQNQNLWWILLRGRHRSCRLQLQRARWRDITEIKIPGVQLLRGEIGTTW